MIISIHNNQMEIVDFMSNDIPGTLKYHDEEITAYLANGCISTFNLTVDKFQNGKLHPRLKYLNDQSYLSFVDGLGDTHLYTIRKIIERDYTMEIEAEDASLEMLNETIGKYEASTEMTFIEYCSSMELLKYTRVEIGLNEVSSKKVKTTFDATQTVLERFFELVSAFNAECEFKTILYPNGQLKYIQLNVYESYSTSEPFKGVGDDRKDIQLHFGREVQGVTITTDKENLFNAIRLKDKDGNYVTAKKNHIWLDSDDLREAYMMRNTHTMYAPKSMMQYPSVSNVNSCDNWSLREFTTELTDYDEQIKYMHTMLKTYMYPIITYEVDMSYFHVFSNYKVRLGDTIYISDPNFLNGLLFQARVSEYKKNPSDTTQNTITLTNAVRITPKINEAMKQRMSELAAMMTPYTMTLKTDNGITFKDMSSESTITPSLFKGTDEHTNVDFMYFQNEIFLGQGDTYTVHANSKGGGTQTITVKAYVSGEPVVSQQITFANVLDGVGLKSTVVAYGLSTSETTQPTSWTEQVPTLTKGKYLWTKTVWTYTDNTSETGYQKTYIAKDGDNGRTQYTHIAYADNATGGGFSLTDQNKAYIGMYVDFTATDSTDPTKYRWTKWKGSDGTAIRLPDGADLDTVTECGFYCGYNLLHAPSTDSWHYIRVSRNEDTSWIVQEAMEYGGNISAFRVKKDNSWQSWQYYAVQNKVAEFTSVNQTKVYTKDIAMPGGLVAAAHRIGNLVTLTLKRDAKTLPVCDYATQSGTVPSGYRPTAEAHLSVAANDHSNVVGSAVIHIASDGTIRLTNGSDAIKMWTGTVTYLTSDQFPA